jgi:hypothetical protein
VKQYRNLPSKYTESKELVKQYRNLPSRYPISYIRETAKNTIHDESLRARCAETTWAVSIVETTIVSFVSQSTLFGC